MLIKNSTVLADTRNEFRDPENSGGRCFMHQDPQETPPPRWAPPGPLGVSRKEK